MMKFTHKYPELSLATMALIKWAKYAPEIGRRALPAYVLCRNGTQSESLISEQEIRESQHSDGGWCNVNETVLLSAICRSRSSTKGYYLAALNWLRKIRHEDAGWGVTNRDISRIPVTGLLLHLLPELSGPKAINWLKSEWRKDFSSDTKLSYKGAFFLLGLKASGVSVNDCPLISETYSFLKNEQNDDGGFGPWRDHPIGSEPWSTGVVLLGLLAYPELTKRKVIEDAVGWLAKNQLPNGLWPYHYIDEGSAYAYWGLVEALKYLKR